MFLLAFLLFCTPPWKNTLPVPEAPKWEDTGNRPEPTPQPRFKLTISQPISDKFRRGTGNSQASEQE